jgi:hypothetical protein
VRPVTGLDTDSQQQQWKINFGLGVSLTGATDHLIAKMILGYRFNC